MKPSSLWKVFILGIAGLWIGVAEQSGFIEDLEVFTCGAYLCENNPQAVSSYLSSGCKDAALLSDENAHAIVMEADSQLSSFLKNSKSKSLSQKNIVFLGSSFLLLGAFLGFTVGYQQEKKKGSSLLL